MSSIWFEDCAVLMVLRRLLLLQHAAQSAVCKAIGFCQILRAKMSVRPYVRPSDCQRTSKLHTYVVGRLLGHLVTLRNRNYPNVDLSIIIDRFPSPLPGCDLVRDLHMKDGIPQVTNISLLMMSATNS